MALVQMGAVSVPLQTSAPITQLRPIVAETEPVVFAAGADYLDDAVELVLIGHSPARLVVFDYHPEADDQREALDAARTRLAKAGTPVIVETLTELVARGEALPAAPLLAPDDDDDPLALLIYTSGSTGAPKGAMYPQHLVANFWGKSTWSWGEPSTEPSITLSFMPMSHVMGRGILYGTLGNGGTAYFAGSSDLSTLFEDLALVRPTELNFVPRIWDMLFQEFQSELDRRLTDGADRAALEAEVKVELRENLLGGRFVSALTGSAPISAEMKAFVESLLDLHLVEGYGSTEAGDPSSSTARCVGRRYDRLQAGRRPRSGLLPRRTSRTHAASCWSSPSTSSPAITSDPSSPRTSSTRTASTGPETSLLRSVPDQLVYLDRRNNVLKLSQGEFVTVSKLEAVFACSPLVRQIYIYGNSARAYLLAVIVPTEDALARVGGDVEQVSR